MFSFVSFQLSKPIPVVKNPTGTLLSGMTAPHRVPFRPGAEPQIPIPISLSNQENRTLWIVKHFKAKLRQHLIEHARQQQLKHSWDPTEIHWSLGWYGHVLAELIIALPTCPWNRDDIYPTVMIAQIAVHSYIKLRFDRFDKFNIRETTWSTTCEMGNTDSDSNWMAWSTVMRPVFFPLLT